VSPDRGDDAGRDAAEPAEAPTGWGEPGPEWLERTEPVRPGPPREPSAAAPEAARPPDRPRLMALALVLAFLLFFGLAGGFGGGDWWRADPGGVVEQGALLKTSLADAPREAWRLVRGTFVHASAPALVVGAFMAWFLGGEVERRAGGGVLLGLVVFGGALLNACRLAVEDAGTLATLAGAWPAGALLGGAALAVTYRDGRGALAVGLHLAIELGLLFVFAASAAALEVGVVTVAVAGLGLGLVLGLALPSRPRPDPAGGGLCLGLAAVLALVGAQVGKATLPPPRPPPPWEAPPPPREQEAFRAVELADLGVGLELPARLEETTSPRTQTCRACDEDVEVPGGPAPAEPIPCPSCGEDLQVRARTWARFVESGSGLFGGPPRRIVTLVAYDKQPFDAPDTVGLKLMGELDGPDSSLAEPVLLAEAPFRPDGAALPGYRVVLRTRFADSPGADYRYWVYTFVGEVKTIQLHGLAPAGAGGDPRRDPGASFDAVAASVRELSEEDLKPGPAGGR